MLHSIGEKLSAGAKNIEQRMGIHGPASGAPGSATSQWAGGPAAGIALVQRYVDALNQKTFTADVYAALFAPNAVVHGAHLDATKAITGVADLLAFDAALLTKTFPDGRLALTGPVTVDNAGFVLVCYTFEGTMRAPFPSGVGVATGRTGCMAGMAKYKLDAAGGKIEAAWVVNDHYALLTSLGLCAPLGGGANAAAACCAGGGGSVVMGGKPTASQVAGGGGGLGQPPAGVAAPAAAGTMMDTQARQL